LIEPQWDANVAFKLYEFLKRRNYAEDSANKPKHPFRAILEGFFIHYFI
jgi:hypothetical protein